ncbi:GNAT family N-acetyltransferase [Aminobacter aganoensis]|uniref:Ribosomal protein S18 acetylase RimI-like enzyme n=1 Tax=Aminobacter aganoensis TaxID=83264 RepID=A0A7X0F7T7_9HYPH|nr:GNAT family N-acetyltransferase [Aminobacter aganoensis]MBB6354620.1 ribosomal protein S18 acetylase RimI-like enzyme [Aminobacter aganoensis]
MFVRTASERDLETIKALLAETWHATYDAIYGAQRVDEITTEWHSLASLKARLTKPNSEFLVADDGKKIAGMAYAAATSDAKVVMLHQLHVRPANQRAGIGRMLLDEVEQCFPEARTLRLEVEQANAGAVAFYKANGFERVGDTDNCGTGQSGIPALIFEKVLG